MSDQNFIHLKKGPILKKIPSTDIRSKNKWIKLGYKQVTLNTKTNKWIEVKTAIEG